MDKFQKANEKMTTNYRKGFVEKTRTKRFIRSEAKSKLFLRTELYINKNEKIKPSYFDLIKSKKFKIL